jgi:hypothetical protein
MQESRGGLQVESMAGSIRSALVATGLTVSDADIDAPLAYVEEVRDT